LPCYAAELNFYLVKIKCLANDSSALHPFLRLSCPMSAPVSLSSPIHRTRQTKIVATLGPASNDAAMIKQLFLAGVDVFRFNFSHGTHADHAARMAIVRALEKEVGRPICVLADLQGPKLRLATFANGSIHLTAGQKLRLDLDMTPGDTQRVGMPHPEIFAAITPQSELLLDDGKVRLRVLSVASDHAETEVLAGTKLSDRKGVNVPGVILPLSALTDKDRRDLDAALQMGADWIALSFVQRPDDVAEARKLVGGRASIMAKLEKPSAITSLEAIVEQADGVMVARGDLGVELPPEDVPGLQKLIVRTARKMLESMITSPSPTRAEASDVATAIYDGADAVMLSAETASGDYPLEAVSMMDRIACKIHIDPIYRTNNKAHHPDLQSTASDAITAAARQVAETVGAAVIVTYTTSGSTTYRAARERPEVPILSLVSNMEAARRLTLCFGVHAVYAPDVKQFSEVVQQATAIARRDGLAKVGERLVITAGVPFGTPGSTNVLRIAWVEEKPAA
jgi:pyruvate kinase